MKQKISIELESEEELMFLNHMIGFYNVHYHKKIIQYFDEDKEKMKRKLSDSDWEFLYKTSSLLSVLSKKVAEEFNKFNDISNT